MNLSRNLIQGAAGGLIGGAVLGILEATYLLVTQGAPDLLSPFYATILYGLIGLGIGLGGGIALAVLQLVRKPDPKHVDALAFAWGMATAVSPMLLFILFYVVNKVVYAEQGIDTVGKVAILAVVGLYFVVMVAVGSKTFRGSLAALTKGPGVIGAYALLALVTLGVSFVPTGANPRSSWSHGKSVPSGMEDSPNVLIIAVDTLRADYLGSYGREGDPSPVLDAIAADGVVFENAFAQASWTRSSFASLWTSRIPSSHNTDKKASRMPDDLDLLSEVAQAAGVTTANLANNINVTSTFNFDQGWDTFIYEAPAYSFGATESVFSLTFYKVLHKVNERLGGTKHVESFYQPVEVVSNDAKGFIEANRDSRWLLGMHLMEPHDPYFEHPYIDGSGPAEFNGIGFARAEVESPEMSQADYLKEVYLHEIIHMDKKLASFVDWLKTEGLYDDLMIVITADHGEEFGEHEGFWHGTTLYEEQIHIPLIIKLPGNKLGGTRVPWQVRSIDVAPTIAAALGIEGSEQWEGSDVFATVRKALAQRKERKAAREKATKLIKEIEDALVESPEDEDLLAALETAKAELADATEEKDICDAYGHEFEAPVISEQDFEGNQISAVRRGGFKYIQANEGNPRGLATDELYDVVEDRGETENLMGREGNRCGTYLDGLSDKMSEEMGSAIEVAKTRAMDGGEVQLECPEVVRLCALGYMSGQGCCDCGYEAACE